MLTRRSFFKSVAAAVAGLALAPQLPTPIFTEPVAAGAVGEFVVWVTYSVEMWVQNPRSCGVVTGIAAGE